MSYNPRELPDEGDVVELRQWLREELRILSKDLNETTAVDLRPSRNAPTRPREGMVVHADGTAWNPGDGPGTYRFQNGLWVKIGAAGTNESGALWGFNKSLGISSTPTTLTRAQSGSNCVSFNANRTVNLPTNTGNGGVNYSFYTLDGGSGGNLTVVTPDGAIIFPDGSTAASVVLSTNQRMGLISDGANWIVQWANFRIATPQGNGIISDQTSLRTVQQMSITADGSGLKLSGDVGSPGNSQLYGTDGSGTKGWFAQPTGGGMTLITSASFPAAATWNFTGLAGYKMLLVSLRGIGQSSGTSRAIQCALSGNNGASYGSVKQANGGTAFGTATTAVGMFMITRCDQTNNQYVGVHSMFTPSLANQIDSSSLGPVNAFQLTWSGAATNFTAGDIDVYGLK